MALSSNAIPVLNSVSLKLSALDIKRMTTIQASTLMAVMRDRIHVRGEDSNGSQIGVYTPKYIKYARKKAGRGTDNKVILSLTRQMENGYILVELPDGSGTGIGFSTHEDFQKAVWCEETYKKDIFAPTSEEKAMVMKIAEEYIAQKL